MKTAQLVAILGGGLDPDVQAFAAYIGSVGSTINYGSLQAVSTAVKQMKGAGLWTSLRVWAPMVGNDLGAARVQFLITSAGVVTFSQATNANFVAGDWVESVGLTGNGTTKYLNTGVEAYYPVGGLGGIWAGTWDFSGNGGFAGAYQSTPIDQYVLRTGSGLRYGRYGKNTVAGGVSDGGAGTFSIDRFSNVLLTYFEKGVAVATTATATTAEQTAFPIFVFSLNVGGTASVFLPATAIVRGYWLQQAMTAAQVPTLHAILAELQQRVRIS